MSEKNSQRRGGGRGERSKVCQTIDRVSESFQVGRLKNFASDWEKVTTDKNILDMGNHFHIDFKDGLPTKQDPNDIESKTIKKLKNFFRRRLL